MLSLKERKIKFIIYVSEGRLSGRELNFLAKRKKKCLERREGAKRSSNFYKSCERVIL